MPVATPSLLELQRAVARELISPGESPAAEFVHTDGIAACDRLNVYRNTYVSTLVSALRIAYPVVHRLVGAAFFEGAAQLFGQAHPPRCAYLNAYGALLGDFLSAFEPAASLPYLPDVARLEWAVNCALHAPDMPGLDAARLPALAVADPARLRLVPHPSVTLLHCRVPADAIWRAVVNEDDAALAAVNPDSGPAWLLVERAASDVQVLRLPEPAWRFAAQLCAGAALQHALEEGCVGADAWLADHLAAGRFVDFVA